MTDLESAYDERMEPGKGCRVLRLDPGGDDRFPIFFSQLADHLQPGEMTVAHDGKGKVALVVIDKRVGKPLVLLFGIAEAAAVIARLAQGVDLAYRETAEV